MAAWRTAAKSFIDLLSDFRDNSRMSGSVLAFGRGLLSIVLVAAIVAPRSMGACCRGESAEESAKSAASCCHRKPADSVASHPSTSQSSSKSTSDRSTCCSQQLDCDCACCHAEKQAVAAVRSVDSVRPDWSPALSDAMLDLAPRVDLITAAAKCGPPAYCDIPHRVLHCSWII
jgi:hypothetical protein